MVPVEIIQYIANIITTGSIFQGYLFSPVFICSFYFSGQQIFCIIRCQGVTAPMHIAAIDVLGTDFDNQREK